MRRHRSRIGLIIFALLILGTLGYVDFEGKVFLGRFKEGSLALIKDKIGLDGTIKDIEGGIFRGIVLKDIELHIIPPAKGQGKGPLFFTSSAINLDYRLWDVAFGKLNKLNKITLVSPKIFFPEPENKFLIPKIVEPAWKEITVAIRDGAFYNAQRLEVVSELNGNFKLSENGIESNKLSAVILGQRLIGKGKIGFPIERSAVWLEGAIKGEGYVLKARLGGVLDKISARGSFDILDKLNLSFAGDISMEEGAIAFRNFDFGKNFILNALIRPVKKGFNIDFFPKNTEGNSTAIGEVSKVGITGDFSKLPYFMLNLNASHLKLLGFDVLTNYNINGKLNYNDQNKLDSVVGDFSTSGSIVNYSPIRELKGTFEVKEGKIKLVGVNYGDVAFFNGTVSFFPTSSVDMNVNFRGVEFGGLADLTLEKGLISGAVSGEIRVYGDLGSELNVDGQLDFLNGNIGAVRYNSAKLKLKGSGTVLEFIDSKVYTEDEALMLEGKVDLREIGSPRFFRNVVLKSDPQTVVWAGTSITKLGGGEEVVMGKDLSEQFRVNFRTYEAGQSQQKRPGQDEMELEYKVGKPASLKLKMKQEEDFFGLEHKVRF